MTGIESMTRIERRREKERDRNVMYFTMKYTYIKRNKKIDTRTEKGRRKEKTVKKTKREIESEK
jgi:hypothetical protein